MDDSCPSAFVSVALFYNKNVHWYLSLAISIPGTVFNIINIIVLTRNNMVSPTNVVLTWLAVADLALFLSYIIPSLVNIRPYSRELFFLAHFISLWMTLVLAIWRYLAVVHPWKARKWCNMDTTYKTVVAVYVLCSLVAFIQFILEEAVFFLVYIWLMFVMPTVALPILTIRLMYELWKAKKRSQKLMSSTIQQNARDLDRVNRTDHTTRMLLVVLFLFLIATLPHATYYFVKVVMPNVISSSPYWDCYSDFFKVFMMLILLDAASNFIVFYSMSCQFRKTCHNLFNCNAFAAAKTVPRNKARNERTAETTPI